mmetsp:Transcript_7834/g.14912  ORF Transcript_7834/g.14912 Transcript_7834/m.14912 type:complete len:430 (+) Transcript_7834:193-1482(+)
MARNIPLALKNNKKKKISSTIIITALGWMAVGVAVATVGYAWQTMQSSTKWDRNLDIVQRNEDTIMMRMMTTTMDTSSAANQKGSDLVGRDATNLIKEFLVDCHALPTQLSGKDPNPGPKFIVQADKAPTTRPFFISLHKFAFDRLRWFIHGHGRYYEFKLEVAWAEILQYAPPGARILDVGGNVGYFSLLSASMGKPAFHVDTFEPNPLNLLRACESLAQNQWENEFANHTNSNHQRSTVNLWQLGVSNTSGTLHFLPDVNPGAGRIVSDTRKTRRVTMAVSVTTLDEFARARGWLQKKNDVVRIEIMKVDVEGHEANVLLGARELLHQGIIRHIFMEYSVRPADRAFQAQSLQVLVDAGYTLCGLGAMRGPKLNNIPFDAHDRPQFIDNFFTAMKRRKEKSINLWWQIDPECKRGSGIKPDTIWNPR